MRGRMLVMWILAISLLATAACGPLFSRRSSEGWVDWDGGDGWSTAPKEAGGKRMASDGAPVEPVMVEEESMDVAPAPTAVAEPAMANDQQPNLRAGSVDDNEQWDDYLLYRRRFLETGIRVHDLDVTERHRIRVTTPLGTPVLGAQVTILDDRGEQVAEFLTHADGSALFFPRASSAPDATRFMVRVSKDGQSAELALEREQREHEVALQVEPITPPVRLDVHFLIDATGSMSDEIEQLKRNMIRVAERIQDLPAQPDVRFGMTVYRDRGDLFVSRTLDFTPDVAAFVQELQAVEAGGGGDYAESLNEALYKAIHLPEWRLEETVSLIFLVADAPPHLDYPQDYDYAEQVMEAAGMGIKIFPLASSGLDDQGEYIFRQLAQITGGKFLFLTYGAGGAPGDDTPHHVDDYSVMSLDQLIVRMVAEELDHLQPGG